jgi:hypothetical protein
MDAVTGKTGLQWLFSRSCQLSPIVVAGGGGGNIAPDSPGGTTRPPSQPRAAALRVTPTVSSSCSEKYKLEAAGSGLPAGGSSSSMQVICSFTARLAARSLGQPEWTLLLGWTTVCAVSNIL